MRRPVRSAPTPTAPTPTAPTPTAPTLAASRLAPLGLSALTLAALCCAPHGTAPPDAGNSPAAEPARAPFESLSAAAAPPPGRLPLGPATPRRSPLAGAAWVGSAACRDCHRQQAREWEASSHASTIRRAGLDDEDRLNDLLQCSGLTVTHVLGDRHEVRWLVERPAVAWREGRWLALPCGWRVHDSEVSLHHPEEWQSLPFETRCAACHVTDFRGDRHSFEEIGVGCEACHGPGGRHVDSEDRADVVAFAELDAAEEATVCARCHLQGGRSASSGLPYAPAYVPGGSLFDDYHFDWAQLDSAPADQALDAHQKMLIRRAVLDGDGSLRCTSCHELHGLSHDKHRRLPVGDPCFTCHDGDVQHLKEYSQSCNTCEF